MNMDRPMCRQVRINCILRLWEPRFGYRLIFSIIPCHLENPRSCYCYYSLFTDILSIHSLFFTFSVVLIRPNMLS